MRKDFIIHAAPGLAVDEDTAEQIVAALKTVTDPEIPVDIYELGLIYKIAAAGGPGEWSLQVDMTLTAPNCPVAGKMPGRVRDALEDVEGVVSADVKLTFDPPWSMERLSEEAQVALNIF